MQHTMSCVWLATLATLLPTLVRHAQGDQPAFPTATYLSHPAGKVEHPHARLTTPELINVRGYPAEVHEATTEDGFIIEIHRIPHGRLHHAHETFPTHAHKAFTHHPQHPHHPHHPQNHYKSSPHRSKGYLNGNLSNHLEDGKSRVANGSYDGDRWSNQDPKVVLLFPGVFSSSADFVMNEGDQALGFILADAGYDVWLGNYRGNFYARRHRHLSTADPRFWDHTWNEIARYDVPALLRYVRAVSGAERVSYIGFSLGTSVFFAMFSYHPEMTSWVRSMAALAPVAYIYHRPAPLGFLSPFAGFIERVLERAEKFELQPLQPERAAPQKAALCGPNSITQPLCIFNLQFQNGYNQGYVDKEYLPVILAHYPAGAGYKVFMHLLQLHNSRKFQAYNYGAKRNYKEYGQPSPPDFPLANVKVPVGLFWSQNDFLASPLDVAETASELPQVALNFRVQRDYNHLDFMWAEDANEMIYRPVISFLDAYY